MTREGREDGHQLRNMCCLTQAECVYMLVSGRMCSHDYSRLQEQVGVCWCGSVSIVSPPPHLIAPGLPKAYAHHGLWLFVHHCSLRIRTAGISQRREVGSKGFI